jgi:FlaA1/EpsC-like NDP-sugar epimerase
MPDLSRRDLTMNIEHLLGRNLTVADDSRAGSYIIGKTILITGAAGSVGSELARRMSSFRPEKVILLDCAESSLYELEWEIRYFYPDLIFETVLCNVVDFQNLEIVFAKFQPQIIFHTAAYKQVPLLEKYPEQAILTNILGTKNLADLAISWHTEKLIFISTDKAVNPASVMGMSKKAAEMYLQSLDVKSQALDSEYQSVMNVSSIKTQFIITRFGNVLGSNGSVVPLFEKQIRAGGPVTVTHPEMTRYFMAISEAAQLVLEAGNLGKGGDIFWFNVAKPVKILDLAHRMMAMLDKKVEVVFTGIRAGEKIYEEWINAERCRILQENPYLIAIEETEETEQNQIQKAITMLTEAVQLSDKKKLVSMLKSITVSEKISSL